MKHEGFKTCAQSGFCKRNRAYADNANTLSNTWTSPYTIDPKTIKVEAGNITGTVHKFLGESIEPVQLPIKITLLQSGAARITVDELKRRQGDIELRHGSQARKERYHEASEWALVGNEQPDKLAKGETSLMETIVNYGPSHRHRAVISHNPFAINFFRDDELHIMFNGKGLMNMEHWRPKIEKPERKEEEGSKEGEEAKAEPESNEPSEDEDTWWEESFGGNTDSKPKGPESIGLDITFHGYEHVYGIPGHASSLSLKQTRYFDGTHPLICALANVVQGRN